MYTSILYETFFVSLWQIWFMLYVSERSERSTRKWVVDGVTLLLWVTIVRVHWTLSYQVYKTSLPLSIILYLIFVFILFIIQYSNKSIINIPFLYNVSKSWWRRWGGNNEKERGANSKKSMLTHDECMLEAV